VLVVGPVHVRDAFAECARPTALSTVEVAGKQGGVGVDKGATVLLVLARTHFAGAERRRSG
jgi:hypothetical protein